MEVPTVVDPAPEASIIVNPADPALASNAVTGGAPADAAIARPPEPGLLDRLNQAAPWWPIAAAILGLAAATYVVRKIWSPTPPPVLYPTWSIEADQPSIETSVPTIPGWPSFSSQTELEWGGASIPEPLPMAEEENG